MGAPAGEGEEGEGDIGNGGGRQKHHRGDSIRDFESQDSKRAVTAARSQNPTPDATARDQDACSPSWDMMPLYRGCLPRGENGAQLTVCLPECLEEKARLLLDALLDAALAHAEVPQGSDGEAPQLLGSLPVAEGYAWAGEWEAGDVRGERRPLTTLALAPRRRARGRKVRAQR